MFGTQYLQSPEKAEFKPNSVTNPKRHHPLSSLLKTVNIWEKQNKCLCFTELFQSHKEI